MINEVNIKNQQSLEKEFANDFASPVFPILGELYLNNKDFVRAEKVCEIGLKHDPENINGYYILAKVQLYNNKLEDAERLLTILLGKHHLHINALRLLIEIQEQLKRPKKDKLNYLYKLNSIFPNDEKLKQKIKTLDVQKSKKRKSESNTKRYEFDFQIKSNLATLTFVDILKQQKHYQQAIQVLLMIEDKTGSTKKTQALRSELEQLLSAAN